MNKFAWKSNEWREANTPPMHPPLFIEREISSRIDAGNCGGQLWGSAMRVRWWNLLPRRWILEQLRLESVVEWGCRWCAIAQRFRGVTRFCPLLRDRFTDTTIVHFLRFSLSDISEILCCVYNTLIDRGISVWNRKCKSIFISFSMNWKTIDGENSNYFSFLIPIINRSSIYVYIFLLHASLYAEYRDQPNYQWLPVTRQKAGVW